MKTEIVTTQNEQMKETDFGTLKTCNGLLDVIENMGYAVKLNVCKTREDLDAVVKRDPDLVVLAVKYVSPGNEDDIWLSEYFSRRDINFTGSPREVLTFDSNKIPAKSYLMNKGIATAKYFTAVPGQCQCENDLPIKFPLFLKPIDSANGNGIDSLSFVTNFLAYERKLLSLYKVFNAPVLVEEYLDGREFTVSVIRTPNNTLLISAIEIIPPTSSNGLEILDREIKNNNTEKSIPIKDNIIKSRVGEIAVDVFRNIGARDFARVDIKANSLGCYLFMEVNLLPGITAGSSYFPKSYEIENNLSYQAVVRMMLGKGLGRAGSSSSHDQNTVAELELRRS